MKASIGEVNKILLKFRRVTIRGAQPSARLSQEICLFEGSTGVSPSVLRGSAGFCGGPRDFSPRVFRGSDPMLVTLGNCWKSPKLQISVDRCVRKCHEDRVFAELSLSMRNSQ